MARTGNEDSAVVDGSRASLIGGGPHRRRGRTRGDRDVLGPDGSRAPDSRRRRPAGPRDARRRSTTRVATASVCPTGGPCRPPAFDAGDRPERPIDDLGSRRARRRPRRRLRDLDREHRRGLDRHAARAPQRPRPSVTLPAVSVGGTAVDDSGAADQVPVDRDRLRGAQPRDLGLGARDRATRRRSCRPIEQILTRSGLSG